MKVCHHKVGEAELPIKRRRRHHDSGKTSDQKLKEKSDGKEHSCLELNASAPHGAYPIEDFDSRGNADSHGGDRKKTVGVGIHSDRKNVVRPNAQAHEGDADRGPDHNGIPENRFARKYRNDFGHEGEARNNQDVDFRVAEYPEEMHPDRGRAARLGVEEMPS